MKTIGIVGGTTWFSSIDYYRYINELTTKKLGGDEAAQLILFSVNFGDIKKLTQKDDWEGVTKIISDAALRLEKAGADVILFGANTMHNIFDTVEKILHVPMIHIADATAIAIKKEGIKTIALLGTKYTMQLPFFSERLKLSGINTIIPNQPDIEFINHSIYEELGKGLILDETRARYLAIINELKKQGAEGVILGCTEIPLLIKQTDCDIPVFDTTLEHCKAAVNFAVSESIDK